MLSLEKSSEIFPRHNGVVTIPESFALNVVISVPLTNKKQFAPLWYKLNKFFL